MTQKFTILFDLDGTLIDTAPDLIRAHNHVMKKFGYPTKTLGELKNAVGRGAKAMMAKANGQWKWFDEKIQNEMTNEFLSYYGENIFHESKLINGVKEFLNWCKRENISMAVCTNKTEHLAVDLLKKIGISAALAAFASVSLSPIIIDLLMSPSKISIIVVKCLGSGLQYSKVLYPATYSK